MASPGDGAASSTGRPDRDSFYCSTSGTYFSDKESLAEHYKSDFHRYNLKRKVAGLPPVTREWFDSRKAQLSSASAAPHHKVWYDPLTKRKFKSQHTYAAHVSSKKYQELVKASGAPAPAPVVMIRQLPEAQQQQQQEQGGQDASSGAAAGRSGGSAPAGFTVKAPHPAAAAAPVAAAEQPDDEDDYDDESGASGSGDDSGWETASDDDDADLAGGSSTAAAAAAAAAGSSSGRPGRRRPAGAAAGVVAAGTAGDGGSSDGGDADAEVAEEDWQEWDVAVSLFDNKVCASMEENLAYMYKAFGFYLPDAEHLADPAGLLKYLGAKLQYGRVPLYAPGDDANARQFRSLHAVQRHMVDTNQCKLAYDGNEDEYAEFYDFSSAADAGDDGGDGEQLAAGMGALSLGSGGAAAAAGGYELVVPGGSGGSSCSTKALGSREFVRFYRQRPKPADARASVAAGAVVAAYRALGVDTRGAAAPPDDVKRAQRERRRQQRQWLNLAMRTNINNNLPKNVPY